MEPGKEFSRVVPHSIYPTLLCPPTLSYLLDGLLFWLALGEACQQASWNGRVVEHALPS
jgi:hypothetical protein